MSILKFYQKVFKKSMINWLYNKIFGNDVDSQYIGLCKRVLSKGVFREGRNGNTYSLFGIQIRFDLSKGLPLLTTKKVLTKAVIHELIWFLKGKTSAEYLQKNNVKIWDLWVDDKNSLPFTYPYQWRSFSNPHGEPIDQISNVIDQIKKSPSSRRLIVSAWNPAEVDRAALPWCHTLFQFYVCNGKLSCQLYQRSADLALGVPFNWASYAILVHIVAQLCELEVGEFIWTAGDVHIYENQIDSLKEQFSRKQHKLPKVRISDCLSDVDEIEFDDIEIIDYKSEPFIKIPVSK